MYFNTTYTPFELEYGKGFVRNGVLTYLPNLGNTQIGWSDVDIIEIIQPNNKTFDHDVLKYYKEKFCSTPSKIHFTIYEDHRNRVVSEIVIDLAKREIAWNKPGAFWEIENFAIRFMLIQNPYNILWNANSNY